MKSLFFNAQVYTGGKVSRRSFLVENSRFTAIGPDAEILRLAGSDTDRINLHGLFVCPGLNDSHMHLISLGQSLRTAQLSGHTGSLAGMLAYLRQFAAGHPPRNGQWLRGRGWNQDYFSDTNRMPDRKDLDAISKEFPIMITRACGHCCVVNSRVLEIAGITGSTPSPDGGRIGLENGEPDGRLYDNAIELREEIGSETLSFIQMAIYEMKSAKRSEAPMLHFQKITDAILAFWGCADDQIDDENTRNIIKIGKRVERIDLYARLRRDRMNIQRDIRRLSWRICRTDLIYSQEGLQRLKELADAPELDYDEIIRTVDALVEC